MDYNHLARHVNANQIPCVAATSTPIGGCLSCVNYLLKMSKLYQFGTVPFCAVTLPDPRGFAQARLLPSLSESRPSWFKLFSQVAKTGRQRSSNSRKRRSASNTGGGNASAIRVISAS